MWYDCKVFAVASLLRINNKPPLEEVVTKKVLPFGTRADFEDDISLEEFRTGERCLLYVTLTRVRKSACMTCYGGLSELIV